MHFTLLYKFLWLNNDALGLSPKTKDESFTVHLEFYHETCSSAVNRIFHNELLGNSVFNVLFQIAVLPRISFLSNLPLYKMEADHLKARGN